MTLDSKKPTSRLQFWGFVFLLGPLPVCGSLTLLIFRFIPNEIGPVETCGFFGAFWGLACGVRSRQLSRAIVGLNCGALAGSAAGFCIQARGIGPDARIFASLLVAAAMGLLAGVLRMEAHERFTSFLKGLATGFSALLVMSLGFFAFMDVLKDIGFPRESAVLLSGMIASAAGMAILLYGMKEADSRG